VRPLSCVEQSASFPGNAGPAVIFLRSTFFSACSRRCALRIAISAIFAPSCGCSFNQRLNASLDTPEMNAADWRDDSRSFVCPENCGSCSFADST
jgi:hypothetical protein